MKQDIFDEMAERWGSPVVARTELKKFSGGLLNGRTMANRDSLGCGIAERFRIGKMIAYPTSAVADFLRERVRPVEDVTS
jgi:hypothetical protein